ncbi:alcohol dehydrogenase catalytic domain-containing protein [Nocardioides sp. J2M5]|uniref:alcohol dehydrogenase catalytic domain-containing protein n=1 Tax=Nocardioides TaxID=1839 RepID=UPI001BA83C49|nr:MULTISPECIES: alcohol dehydrogenase catalytic domain-containing protein [Nocardioides]MBS2937952.1 alcohol dehydrogenase catalytic domain-containing protein [Nocardioides palaemonis]
MRITGAVLEELGRPGPWAETRPLTVSELELEGPGPGEVLVRIAAAGVCHSDLSVVNGNRPRPVPMLLGHEASGRVVALGDGVTELRVGQQVVMTFLPRCGHCEGCATDGRMPCVAGSASNAAGELLGGGRRLTRDGVPVHHHLGVSAFATHAVVDTRSVVAVEDDVPPDVAAVLGCAVLTGGGALLNAAPPEPGQSVMVVGLGGVGMAALLTAIALGRGDVVAVDGVPAKRDQARQLGASTVLDPGDLASSGIRCDVVVEAAGNARAFEAALAATAPGGRTVTVGLPPPDALARISPLQLVAEARTVVGSYLGSAVPARDIPVFAQWWREGRLPVEELVSSRITLDDINRAMDDLAAGTALRQIVEL